MNTYIYVACSIEGRGRLLTCGEFEAFSSRILLKDSSVCPNQVRSMRSQPVLSAPHLLLNVRTKSRTYGRAGKGNRQEDWPGMTSRGGVLVTTGAWTVDIS